jgi:hypothetical protein
LPLDQLVHVVIGHGFGKTFIDPVEFVHQVNRFLDTLLDDFPDGLGFVYQRLLLQVSDGVSLGKDGFTVEFRVHAGHDFEQGAFAGTVKAQYTDFGTIEITQGDIFNHRFFIIEFADAHHGIDDFVGIVAHRPFLLKLGCVG